MPRKDFLLHVPELRGVTANLILFSLKFICLPFHIMVDTSEKVVTLKIKRSYQQNCELSNKSSENAEGDIKTIINNFTEENLLQNSDVNDLAILKKRVTEFEFIDDEKRLAEISELLTKCTSVGIDTEQTYDDSYHGYICLIQLSTQDKNIIIDTIVLHDVIARYLGPLFRNPNIIKVFYAGSTDLLWLHRDFRIKVVNYFDIHAASAWMNKHKDNSLVGLLKEYCGIEMEKALKKEYQTSDWRLRPLTRAQLEYACLDSNYLLYLRAKVLEAMNAAKSKEEVLEFLRKMQLVCRKDYEKKEIPIDALDAAFCKCLTSSSLLEPDDKKKTNQQILLTKYQIQRGAFLNLAYFREKIAQETDTNPNQLINNQDLLLLAFNMEKAKAEFSKIPFYATYLKEITDILSGKGTKDYSLNVEKKKLSEWSEEKLKRKEEFKQKFLGNKTGYDNCKILSPDNQLLCYCSKEKIEWYLKRNLGELVSEDPSAVRLFFQPSGNALSDLTEFKNEYEVFMKHSRENQCVVCGKTDNFFKYHVVPSYYRNYFPLELKSHRSHDILLLCWTCLVVANQENEKFKAVLAERYGVPLLEKNIKLEIVSQAEGLKKSLLFFQQHRSRMPEDRFAKRVADFQSTFHEIYQCAELTEDTREEMSKLDFDENGKVKINEKLEKYFIEKKNFKKIVQKTSNQDLKQSLSGKKIVEKLKTTKDFDEFVNEWRQFFLKAMNPQFLPSDWLLKSNDDTTGTIPNDDEEKKVNYS